MDAKSICEQQLTHLSTAVIMGKRAPHKAVLLLAIMDLVEAGKLSTPRIELSKELDVSTNIRTTLYFNKA